MEATSGLRTTRYLPGAVTRGAANAKGNKLSTERIDNMLMYWTGVEVKIEEGIGVGTEL